jgi:pSer/pThr/pTyr-binding forkhead associated (FHA) protein
MSIHEPFRSWLIALYAAQVDNPLQIIVDNRVILGRKDTGGNLPNPEIDLTPFNADQLGVSRHHLEIYVEEDLLRARDLNSGNGTLLNGVKLNPNNPVTLKHNDHLQLGNLKLDMRIIITPSYRSTLHKQTNLQLHDTAQPTQGELIQIVEDDIGTAKLLSLIMERAGFKSIISRDVPSGIRAFNQQRPAAAIVDVMLPNMDGLEFVRYVRREVKGNSTPLVAVAADSMREMVDNALKAGSDLFLGQPINANDLTHVVTSLVAYHKSGVSALKTRHLIGTAPLKRIAPETRRIAAVLFVRGFNEPIVINLSQPVSLGRLANPQNKHHVDLSRFAAVDQGVSRIHIFLHYKEGQFFVQDNHTVNGTLVNGEPSKSGELSELHNADEIRLGKLSMYIYFLTEEESGDTGNLTD